MKEDVFSLAEGSCLGFVVLGYMIRHSKRLEALVLRDTAASDKGLSKLVWSTLEPTKGSRLHSRLLKVGSTAWSEISRVSRLSGKASSPVNTYSDDPDTAEAVVQSSIFFVRGTQCSS